MQRLDEDRLEVISSTLRPVCDASGDDFTGEVGLEVEDDARVAQGAEPGRVAI